VPTAIIVIVFATLYVWIAADVRSQGVTSLSRAVSLVTGIQWACSRIFVLGPLLVASRTLTRQDYSPVHYRRAGRVTGPSRRYLHVRFASLVGSQAAVEANVDQCPVCRKQPTLEQLTQASSDVVLGTVTSFWNRNRTAIYTGLTLTPQRTSKGNFRGEVTVALPGGSWAPPRSLSVLPS
jgi:hypothetical protein